MTSGAIGWLNNEIGLVVSVIDRSGISQGDDKVWTLVLEIYLN